MNTRDEKMGNAPIPKLILSLALPSVLAQLINVLYNIVDRIYIGHIPEVGALALTGVGVTFPILMLITAFAAFAGAGGAPLAAIQMGKGNHERAERILGNAFSMLITFSVILTIVFSVFKTPLLYMFGASDDTIVYAQDYISLYLFGTIFVQTAIGLNPFIASQGKAKTAMLSVLVGAITNIVLDPIFIFGFGMGVRGAALATILSQAVSAAWVLKFLTSKKSSIRVRFGQMKPELALIGSIAALGIAPFIMQSTESAVNIVLNRGLQQYGGDLYVGSMTILQSVMQLLIIPISGFTQGVQPIISFNFGAKKFDRVRKTCLITMAVACTISILGCIVTVFMPEMLAVIFTEKAEMIELVKQVMPIFMSGIWLFGAQMACQTTFLGLGQAKMSLFIALLRKIILLIPLAIILPAVTGSVMGIYWAEPISDLASASTAILLFLIFRKKMLSEEALAKLK